jgi:hypothetical protein
MIRRRLDAVPKSVSVDVDHRLEVSEHPNGMARVRLVVMLVWGAFGPRECLTLPAKIMFDFKSVRLPFARVGHWSMLDRVNRRVTRWAEIR